MLSLLVYRPRPPQWSGSVETLTLVFTDKGTVKMLITGIGVWLSREISFVLIIYDWFLHGPGVLEEPRKV